MSLFQELRAQQIPIAPQTELVKLDREIQPTFKYT